MMKESCIMLIWIMGKTKQVRELERQKHLLKEYFMTLFVQNDIKKCDENFKNFENSMNSEYKKCQMLLNKIRKKYMHYTNKNPE